MEPIQQALPSSVVMHIGIVVPATLLVTGLIMCYGGSINDHPRAVLPRTSSHSLLVVGTMWRHPQGEDTSQGKENNFIPYLAM